MADRRRPENWDACLSPASCYSDDRRLADSVNSDWVVSSRRRLHSECLAEIRDDWETCWKDYYRSLATYCQAMSLAMMGAWWVTKVLWWVTKVLWWVTKVSWWAMTV